MIKTKSVSKPWREFWAFVEDAEKEAENWSPAESLAYQQWKSVLTSNLIRLHDSPHRTSTVPLRHELKGKNGTSKKSRSKPKSEIGDPGSGGGGSRGNGGSQLPLSED